jgi:hypothetical protein
VLNTCSFSIAETTRYHDEKNVYFDLEKLFGVVCERIKSSPHPLMRTQTGSYDSLLGCDGVKIWQNDSDKSAVSIFRVEEATNVSQIESV